MKRPLLALLRFYRRQISPLHPGKCRIEKYGAWKGGWLSLWRLIRCNPFNHGDHYDPIP